MRDSIPLLRAALVVLAALCLCWAMLVFVTGGVYWSAGALRISSRDAFRPVSVALLLVLGYWCVTPGALARFADAVEPFRTKSGVLAVGVALAVAAVGLIWGSRVAGAADPYGYISQADLWRGGQLKVRQPIPEPWPYDDWTLAPLGYKPGLERHTIVPTYPPGLPLLMAAAGDLLGSRGRFLIVPLTGAVAILATFMLGAIMFDELVGVCACVLLAASPAFLFQLMLSMNDVPVTAAWAVALVLALLHRPLAAGIASGLAMVIRPNLPLLTVGVGLLAALPASPERRMLRAAVRRALSFGAGVLPGVVGIAVWNTSLYGGPLHSGYGEAASLYHWSNLWPNVARYSRWLIETNTPFVAGAIPALVSRRCAPGRASEHAAVRGALALFVIAVAASYVFYTRFEDWTYVRFMMPAFPVMLVAAVGCIGGTERVLGRVVHTAVFMTLIVLVFTWQITASKSLGAFTIQQNERHYEIVARELRQLTPVNSVVLSMQDAGSVRYYAGRMIVRYDNLPQGAFDEAVSLLIARGLHPYLLLESTEIPFGARAGRDGPAAHLAQPPVREWTFPNRLTVRLYDLANQPTRIPRS
jgi:hypothetical protein